MSSAYRDLYRRFSILPHDEKLYEKAFTHSSYNGMVGTHHEDYERMEFLGDSIIGMVASILCYKLHPEMEQGQLSVLKSQFICSASEAEYCKKIGLVPYIRVGASLSKAVETNTPVLEDVFESFIGAVYLDQGLDFCVNLVTHLIYDDIKNAKIDVEINPKSRLQEAMQAERRESVTYKILEDRVKNGVHEFLAAVYFENEELGRGVGPNKKAAETAAARDALSRMSLPEDY